MKQKGMVKTIFAAVLAATLALPAPVFAAKSYVKSLELSDEKITLEVQDLDFVDAEVKVAGNASTEVTVKSSDPEIADVTEFDYDEEEPGVTSLNVESFERTGTATITVTTVDKGENGTPLSQKFTVTVVETLPDDPEAPETPEEADSRKDGDYDEDDGSKTTIVTDDETNVQTKTNIKENDDGSTVETTTVFDKNTGDSEVTVIEKDLEGNIISEAKSTKVTMADGSIVETGELTRQDGSGYVETLITDPEGNISYIKERKGIKGNVRGVQTRDESADGSSIAAEYSAEGDDLTLTGLETNSSVLMIADTIETRNGKSYSVIGIGDEAASDKEELTDVIMGAGIRTLGKGSFKNCKNMKNMIFSDTPISKNQTSLEQVKAGSADKIVLGKNCLKKTSKKLTIGVQSKKDKKAVKKQLKKAGNKRAKIKVGYRMR